MVINRARMFVASLAVLLLPICETGCSRQRVPSISEMTAVVSNHRSNIQNVEIKAVCYGNITENGVPIKIITLATYGGDGKRYFLFGSYNFRLQKKDFGEPVWDGHPTAEWTDILPILENDLNLKKTLRNPTPRMECSGKGWKKF